MVSTGNSKADLDRDLRELDAADRARLVSRVKNEIIGPEGQMSRFCAFG